MKKGKVIVKVSKLILWGCLIIGFISLFSSMATSFMIMFIGLIIFLMLYSLGNILNELEIINVDYHKKEEIMKLDMEIESLKSLNDDNHMYDEEIKQLKLLKEKINK